jgi:hypothetical protein
MNKILKISLLAMAVLLLDASSMMAQRRQTKKEKTEEDTEVLGGKKKKSTKSTDSYFDESGGFKHRLWYGGNFILNFTGNNYGSAFAVGVTPMVGYKIIGGLSAGPRLGVVYNSQGIDNTRISWTDYSAGAFARYKFLGFLFLHAEYGFSSRGTNFVSGPNGSIEVLKTNRFSPNLGAGYNSGNGVVGYEIALLYDPTLANNPNISPLDIRFGFTYNF